MNPIALRWYQSVSIGFHPILIPWAALLTIVPLDEPSGIAVLISAFVLIMVFPMGASLVYFIRKGHENKYVVPRKLRIMPFVFFFSGLGMLFLLTKLMQNGSLPLNWLIVVSTVAGVGFIVTFFYKASLHMMGVGATFSMMIIMIEDTEFALAVSSIIGLLAIVVFHARWKLQAHTFNELVIGFALGAISCFAGFQLAEL